MMIEELRAPVECAFHCYVANRWGGWCYHPQCQAFAAGMLPAELGAAGGTAPSLHLIPTPEDERTPTLLRDQYETRSVLAAAYPGGRRAKLTGPMLTHLVHVATERALCGRVKEGHLADAGSGTAELFRERPTCKRCARSWDLFQIAQEAVRQEQENR